MSFGVSAGLAQMYGSGNRLEEAKTELATMQMFKQQIDADKEKQEKAQLMEQEHLDQISRMADKFLAPDRNKINEKSKELAKIIQNQVRMHGGDTKKFFEEGGHRYINQYKTEIMNSPEASQAITNKENMERILQLQMSGMHAKLNPYDLKNLDRYEREGGGEITFTGLMTDIQMPNPNLFGYDEMIPAEAILYSGNNKLAIMGNFKLSNPDHEGEPTDEDLLQFVKQNYQSKGGNQQSAADLRRAREAKATMGYLGREEGELHFNKEAMETLTGNVGNIFNNIKPGTTVNEFLSDDFWKKHPNADAVDKFTNSSWNVPAYSYRPVGEGPVDFSTEKGFVGPLGKMNFATALLGIPAFLATNTETGRKFVHEIMNDAFTPANAKQVFKGNEMALIRTAMGVPADYDLSEIYDPMTKKLKNYAVLPHGFFTANGAEIKNTKLDPSEYQGEYQYQGTISVGVASSKNTDGEGTAGERRHIVMNVTDKKGNKIDSKTEKYNKLLDGGEVSNKMAIVLKDDFGNVFYQLLDTNPQTFQTIAHNIGEPNDIIPTLKEAQNNERKKEVAEAQVKQTIGEYETFWSNVGSTPEVVGAMNQELKSFSRDNRLDGVRNNLLKSFYAAEAQGNTAQGNDAEKFRHATSQAIFTERVNEINQDYDIDLSSWLTQYQKYPNQKIIEDLSMHDKEKNNGAGSSFYEAWLRNLIALNNL